MEEADVSPVSSTFKTSILGLSTVSSNPLDCAVESAMDVVALSPHHHGV